MAGIKDYSVVAASNTLAPPDGAPEGMLANTVNNTMREMMALMKGGTPYTVANVVAVKALDSTLQVTGNLITVTGLVTAGTGSGIFRYDSASAVAGDDVDVIEPTDSIGRWLRNEATESRDIVFSQANPNILGADTNGVFTLSAGVSDILGFAIKQYGDTHATQADDFEGYASGVLQIHYDDSASIWDFQANAIVTTGPLTCGALTSTGIDDNATEKAIDISAGEEVTMALQPAFLAFRTVDDSNVTGNGTVYTAIFDDERFDQASNYNTATGLITVPVGGRYRFSAAIQLGGDTGASTSVDVSLVTSNETYRFKFGGINSASGFFMVVGSLLVDMDASDTAKITITVSGEASDVIDFEGNGTAPLVSCFSGELVV